MATSINISICLPLQKYELKVYSSFNTFWVTEKLDFVKHLTLFIEIADAANVNYHNWFGYA